MPKDVERILGENEVIRFVQRDELINYRKSEVSQHLQSPDQRGLMFIDLLRSWGMVAGRRGNDTATGHPAMELVPVEEVINRARMITESAYEVMKEKGWLVVLDRSEPSSEDDK